MISTHKFLQESFSPKNTAHLVIVTLASIPLTSILIILFIIATVRLRAITNLSF